MKSLAGIFVPLSMPCRINPLSRAGTRTRHCIVGAILTVLFWLPAYRIPARIGETEAQIEARYGKPLDPLTQVDARTKSGVYVSAGITILVYFFDGHSQGEQYSKNHGKIAEGLSDQEISILLTSNGFGAEWVEDDTIDPMGRYWFWGRSRTVSDYRLIAFYKKLAVVPTLCIVTREYGEKVHADSEKKEKENLSGF